MKDNLLDEADDEQSLSEAEQEARNRVNVMLLAFPIIFVGLVVLVLSQCSSRDVLG